MTISTEDYRITYAGNGVTTAFATGFEFPADSDLVVVLVSSDGTRTTQTITTDYTVAGAGDAAGGTVTMVTAPASGESLVIYRDVAYTQATDYVAGDPFPAETHEDALDKLTMLAQQNKGKIERALRLSDADASSASAELPTPEALKAFRWNAGATALEVVTLEDPAGYGTLRSDITAGNVTTARGWVSAASATYVSGTQFKRTGNYTASASALEDQLYEVGGRVRANGTSTGTITGFVTAVDYGVTEAGHTTVTVAWDSGSLSNEALTVWAGAAGVVGTSLPVAVVITSISDLRGLTSGQTVYLRGHTTVGDGGEGLFYFVSGASAGTYVDNGGTIIVPTGGNGSAAWLRVYGRDISVKWFGATGDGSTDDSTAIQNAIDFAVDNPTTAPTGIYFPAGTYRVTTKLTKSLAAQNKRVRIYGERGRSTINSEVTGDRTLELIDASLVTIECLRFTGNSTTGAGGNGHAVALVDSAVGSGTYYPAQCDLRDLDIEGFRGNDTDEDSNTIVASGIYVGAGLGNYLDRCRVDDCGHGIFFYKTQNSHITRCVVDDADKWAVRFEQTQDTCSVSDSDLVGSGENLGVYSETISGQTAPYGSILVHSTSYAVNINNNKMKNGPAGVTIVSADQVCIDGNHIRPRDKNDNGFAGVYGKLAKLVSIKDNNFFFVGGAGLNYTGINLDAAQNTSELTAIIENNLFDHASTVDEDIVIDGNGSSNDVVVSIVGNKFGTPTRAGGPTVTDCIKLTAGTYHGRVQSNQFIAGDDGTNAHTITDALDISGITPTEELTIESNANATYLSGTLTNPCGLSRESGRENNTTDGSGDLTISHNLVKSPVAITTGIQGTTAYQAQVHTLGASSFKLRIFDATGSAVTSTAVVANWSAHI